mgnify:CR=1 FL=1
MTVGPSSNDHVGAEYQIGDAIQGRWLVRSVCGGRGRSGMGVVYIVDDRLYGGTHAVKTLQPHLVADATVRDLIRAEANLWLAMGRHPNIVALTYVETLQNQIYMFMEYIAPDAAGRNCLTHFLTDQRLDDPIVAKKLVDIGCPAVMPLAAPIGSGLGIRNPYNLKIIMETVKVPIIVDAGVGTASDAALAMEYGADAVLMNTAIAGAQDPIAMAEAMKYGVWAGRLAYKAGRIPRKLYATASSPIEGML